MLRVMRKKDAGNFIRAGDEVVMIKGKKQVKGVMLKGKVKVPGLLWDRKRKLKKYRKWQLFRNGKPVKFMNFR